MGVSPGRTCSLLMASESWSARTLQATSSWAVDAATCLAEEMSFSSLAWPCTDALAASHRLLVAAATMRACGPRGAGLERERGVATRNGAQDLTGVLTAEMRPCDHWPSSTALARLEPTWTEERRRQWAVV